MPVSAKRAAAVQTVASFIRRCGLSVDQVDHAITDGFVPGVRIRGGVLIVGANAAASTLLHEAGHLAILPGDVRGWASDDLDGVAERMFDWIRSEGLAGDPDAPLMRAALQASDPEATAWAWAAGTACGLAPAAIIGDREYDGEGAEIRLMLSARRYVGIHGLHHAGLCGMKQYPRMKRWVQPRFVHRPNGITPGGADCDGIRENRLSNQRHSGSAEASLSV